MHFPIEVVVVTAFVRAMIGRAYNNRRIQITTDSRAALTDSEARNICSKVVNECPYALRVLKHTRELLASEFVDINVSRTSKKES